MATTLKFFREKQKINTVIALVCFFRAFSSCLETDQNAGSLILAAYS